MDRNLYRTGIQDFQSPNWGLPEKKFNYGVLMV
jgi:hypothetical protein